MPNATDNDPSVVLSIHGLRKIFPGVVALDSVDFDVRAGEIHALLGANGAGKSTLIKVVAGLYAPDGGDLFLSGRKVRFNGASDAMAAGIGVIYQDFALVPHMTVSENIFLGSERLNALGLVDWSATRREARKLLDLVGAPFSADARVAELGTGHRQLVEIAKALRRDSKVLILDEPTASLSQGESDRLLELIRSLAKKGVGIVYVSHRLEEIAGLVSRVTILRDGRSMGTFPASELDRKRIVSLITGQTELRARQRQAVRTSKPPLIETKGLGRKGEFQDVSISVAPGEVVVLTGLVGAGRTELLQTIFSARRPDQGDIIFRGEKLSNSSVRDTIRNGIALIPEDRRGEGLCVILPVHENIAMAALRRFLGAFGLSRPAEISHARKMIADLNIRPPSPGAISGALSGGNQQKVVLAKWLSTDASLFLFDEPTQGVDVGAKSDIYDIIERLTARDKAVLIASSDLEEVLLIADRVIAMHQGRIVGEFFNDNLNASVVMDAITRGAAE
jgi:ABC-type sugar transport system ATPase subunit